MKRILFILIFAFVATGCSTPLSKDRYLKNFDTFISEVSENYKNYSDKDWEQKTEKFQKFSVGWYEKFKDDFSWKEKLKIATFHTKFHYYSTLGQTSSAFKELLETLNVQEIKSKVRDFINNDMEAELNQLYEEARKAGKAAEEAITEILNELQISIEELQK